MIYLDIAVNIPLNQTFFYSFDGESFIDDENTDKAENTIVTETGTNVAQIGKRVEIRFGNRKTTGFIINIYKELPSSCPVDKTKIKCISKILDSSPLFDKELLELSYWISRYYLCSIGEAISSMIPSGKRETNAGGFSFADELPDSKSKKLSNEQIAAVEGIFAKTKNNIFGKPNNLHYVYGSTGSGKTEVFLQASERVLENEQGVIYLVPEISLTQQIIEAFVNRLGNTVAILHSGLTPSQKLLQWHKIQNKETRVVIGARSAIFAPVPNLGLIIIDEEHDASYKSGTTPRYHARQVAMYRAARLKIPLVMGSATPSVEAWHLMQNKTIYCHTLTKRLAGGAFPKINCIDLNNYKMSGCLSQSLCEEIKKTIENKRQVILFLNRRGFTHFFRCNSCGFELTCKNCSVNLTYHKNENRLRCHYCGWSTEVPHECPRCASLDVGYSGFGTEFIENEVRSKFPNARIVRIDTDSLTKKGELQEKLNSFTNGDYDIMLGTQMVAKGLNFPNLQLVGIVLADTSLHLPDFRSAERTFSLITQVSGRAGRFFPDGKVVVQTYNPNNSSIFYASTSKIEEFYNEELEMRKMLNFPPYTRLIRLVFRSPSQKNAENAAKQAADLVSSFIKNLQAKRNNLQNDFVEVLGPSECPIEKIAMNHRYQILLRGKNIRTMQEITHHLLYDYKHTQDVYIETDVDPVSLL